MSVQFMSVTSSNVARIAYDEGTLYVAFHVKKRGRIVGDKLYQFDNIPLETYLAFISAPSHGVYFNQHIKGKPFKIIG